MTITTFIPWLTYKFHNDISPSSHFPTYLHVQHLKTIISIIFLTKLQGLLWVRIYGHNQSQNAYLLCFDILINQQKHKYQDTLNPLIDKMETT